MKIKNIISAFLLLLLLMSVSFALNNIRISDPDFFSSYKGVSKLKKTGEISSSYQNTVSRDGDKLYMDSVSSDRKGIASKSRGEFDISGNNYTLVKFTSDVTKNDKPFMKQEFVFDWQKDNVSVMLNDLEKGKTTTKTTKLTERTVLVQYLTITLRRMLYSKVADESINLLLPTGDTFNMKVHVNYLKQNVILASGPVECFKVEMKPDLGFISGLIPNVNFFFNATAPYRFVRYEGSESGPGSADIIQDAKD